MAKCIRCSKSGFFTYTNKEGYCSKCADLKSQIKKIIEMPYPINDLSATQAITIKKSNLLNEIHKENICNFDNFNINNVKIRDIKLSSLEKSFLYYLNSLPIKNPPIANYWTINEFIDYKSTVEKFIYGGYMTISHNKNIAYMSVAELKAILKLSKLKVSGNKNELMQRIIESLSIAEIQKLTYSHDAFFYFTEKGNEVTANVRIVVTHDVEFENECLSLILNNQIEKSYSLICKYELKKAVPRGLNIDWQKELQRGLSYFLLEQYKSIMNNPLTSALPIEIQEHQQELKACIVFGKMLGLAFDKIYRLFSRIHSIKEVEEQLIIRIMKAIYFDKAIDEIIFDIDEAQDTIYKEFNPQEKEDIFIEHLKNKILSSPHNIDWEKITLEKMSDKTINFKYNGCQIGRLKIGKKTSGLQVLDTDNVEWYSNKPLEFYISKIDLWIDYIVYLKISIGK